MMIRSMPPASAHLALRPVPAPPPMIGLPAATWARSRSRHCSRVKKLIPTSSFLHSCAPAATIGVARQRGTPAIVSAGWAKATEEVPTMPVVFIGTLDTKGTEVAFVRDLLREAGVATLVIDAGVLGPPAFPPDVPREEVYAAAGTGLAAVRQANDRGRAIEAAARGVAKVVLDLHGQGRVDGVLALGGSAGTTIGTAAMRALPFGVPKLMVSTLASGQVKQYVGVRDILMLNSVVDISGLNRISRTVL